MPLGMEVGLSPGNTVLDGTHYPAPASQKGTQQPPLFGPCLLRTNAPRAAGAPLPAFPPCSFTSLSLTLFCYLSLFSFLIHFTYFIILSIPSPFLLE